MYVCISQALEAAGLAEEKLKNGREQLRREVMEAAARADDAEHANAGLAASITNLTEQLAVRRMK